MVGDSGFEPLTSSVSTRRSPPELTAHVVKSNRTYYTHPARICKEVRPPDDGSRQGIQTERSLGLIP